MEIQIKDSPVSLSSLTKLVKDKPYSLVKAVVDIQKKVMAIGGELHSDAEAVLMEQGSAQGDLWGVNLYPAQFGKEHFIEFDSMINIRPSQKNMSRGVDDIVTRSKIKEIIESIVKEK